MINQIKKTLRCLMDTVERTTHLESVYNNKPLNSESVTWEEVRESESFLINNLDKLAQPTYTVDQVNTSLYIKDAFSNECTEILEFYMDHNWDELEGSLGFNAFILDTLAPLVQVAYSSTLDENGDATYYLPYDFEFVPTFLNLAFEINSDFELTASQIAGIISRIIKEQS